MLFVAAACSSTSTRPHVSSAPAPPKPSPNIVFVGDEAVGRAFVDAMRARHVDADALTTADLSSTVLATRIRSKHVVAHAGAADAIADAVAKGELNVASLVLLNGTYPIVDANPLHGAAVGGVRAPKPFATRCAVVSSTSATGEVARAARRWANTTGAARHHVVERDERSIVAFSPDRDDVADFVVSFVTSSPAPGGPDSGWSVRDTWNLHPPFTTEPFWRDTALIERRPTDDALKADVKRVFAGAIDELQPWPGATYDAIDLARWLDAHPELGRGSWVTLENVRGERLVLHKKTIAAKKPVIVIGLDDERNLFRLLVTYNVYRSHSWEPEREPRPLLARPLGAFLHVRGEENGLGIDTFARYALTTDGIRVLDHDPLAKSRAHVALVDVLDGRQGCLQCHALAGEGARAHHVRARDGASQGADAIALDAYPPGVLERFLFHQEEVAASFGVSPLRVERSAAEKLLGIAKR